MEQIVLKISILKNINPERKEPPPARRGIRGGKRV